MNEDCRICNGDEWACIGTTAHSFNVSKPVEYGEIPLWVCFGCGMVQLDPETIDRIREVEILEMKELDR